MPSSFRRVVVLKIALVLLCATRIASASVTTDERAVENLAAFARAYGYVRFFHPSDEASAIDWDKFAVLGAERVRDAANDVALGEALRELIAPLGAGLQVVDASAPALTSAEILAPPDQRATYWQHLGVELSTQPNVYKSRRVVTGGAPQRYPLFESPVPAAVIEKSLGGGWRLRLPLVLAVTDDDRTPAVDQAPFEALQALLASVDPGKLKAEDWQLRVAGIITAWNVFQHFHPYLDGSGIPWADALRPALRRTLADRDRSDYHATLSEMVAKLQDGHGYVFGRDVPVGGLPIRVAKIEDQLVVTAAAPETPFRKGDVLLSIDGEPALEILRDRERYVSGSPHLRRFRALNQFGEGPLDSTARIERRRDNERQSVDVQRARDRRGFFFNPIGEFEFPPCAEVRPGIFYVNLPSITQSMLAEKMPALAAAKGVIFDERWDGRNMTVMKPEERVSPHQHIIPHLTAETLQASPMRTPQITLPDREGWKYRESTWPVEPKAPRLAGHVVFINEPPVVSYGETCMAMIAHYKLATLVGEPTAGCNGNINFIPLPGGFRIMWTGMEVIQHDRSPFYGVGFVPDVPVARTLEAVKAGRDEFLEQAIAAIEKNTRKD